MTAILPFDVTEAAALKSYVLLDADLQPAAYAKAREIWLKNVQANNKNTAILGNAA